MFNRNHRDRRMAAYHENEEKTDLKSVNWTRLISYLKPHRKNMALAVLALLFSSGFGLAFPLVIVQLLESVTGAREYDSLNLLAGVLVLIFLLQAAFRFLQSYLLSYVGENIVCELRTSLYRHLQKLSLDFYSSNRVGDLVSRISSDVTQMRTVLTNTLTTLLSQVIMLVGSIVILLQMNAGFTLFILGMVPFLLALAYFFGRRIQKSSAQIQDELADSTVVAEEGLQGIRVVKSFVREDYETQRYQTAMQKTLGASLKMALNNSLFASLMMFLGFGSIGAIMWYGGREVIAGRLDLAMITGFLIYGISIAGSLGSLGGLYGQFNAALGGVRRVFELLDTVPAVQDADDAMALSDCEGQISLQQVNFSYDGRVDVLKGIDLDINAGEILALVGPSGAGKSTIFNLIPRFYDVTDGSIQIDGHDVRSITQESLRNQMAIVPQETILFGGSIRENILYGKLDASEDEMVAASRAANAHDFIMSFPDGYETIVGERGMNLSGGQRQRISIARAILKDPRILLLDEATSSLDNESEELVQEALHRLMQNRTTVIIAHRLSTVKVAHRIAVLDEGQIIEAGTHEELMEHNGLYAHLYLMQFRNTDVEDTTVGLFGRPDDLSELEVEENHRMMRLWNN